MVCSMLFDKHKAARTPVRSRSFPCPQANADTGILLSMVANF